MPKAQPGPLASRNRRRSQDPPAMEPAVDAFVIDDEAGICRYLSAALG